jgi:acetyl esterase/lipase
LANVVAGTIRYLDVPYGPEPVQAADIYVPEAPGPHRLAVWIHGGSWTMGGKGGRQALARCLNAEGFALASLGYRKAPETDIAGCMEDVAAAVAFLVAQADRFGLDTRRFALMGHSSGGHMAALLAIDPVYLRAAGVDPARVAAVITLDGVFDVGDQLRRYPRTTSPAVFGTEPARWDDFSPCHRLADMQGSPLFGLMREDTERRFGEQGDLFEAALLRHGARFVTALAPGLNHGEILSRFGEPDQPMAAFFVTCLRQAAWCEEISP